MSEQGKTREMPDPDIFGPPFFGVGLGEKLGSLDARLIHVEKEIGELKGDVKNLSSKVDELAHTIQHRFGHVDAKFGHMDAKFDHMDTKFGHMNEKFAGLEKRMDSNTRLLWGMFTAMLAAIVIQKFL